jgi:hypothetical protein
VRRRSFRWLRFVLQEFISAEISIGQLGSRLTIRHPFQGKIYLGVVKVPTSLLGNDVWKRWKEEEKYESQANRRDTLNDVEPLPGMEATDTIKILVDSVRDQATKTA